jgi:hypothetical protein
MRNVPAGAYRVKVMHPNLSYPVYDGRIRVFTDKPTFVPIKIPANIFSNTPIAVTAEADLTPLQAKLGSAAASADAQANKKGGQPIYADDWNQLSGVTADIAQITIELSQKVSPIGHDHPELVEKMKELQSNMDKLFDVFGKTVAELQRQIQQLALEVQVSRALDKIQVADRAEFDKHIKTLGESRKDTPYVYTSTARRTGEELVKRIRDAVPIDKPELLEDEAVREVLEIAQTMAASQPAFDYVSELKNQQRLDNARKSAGFSEAMQYKR